jgi:hypothetical protein
MTSRRVPRVSAGVRGTRDAIYDGQGIYKLLDKPVTSGVFLPEDAIRRDHFRNFLVAGRAADTHCQRQPGVG